VRERRARSRISIHSCSGSHTAAWVVLGRAADERRTERVARQQVLGVHDEQPLVLLLVVQPERQHVLVGAPRLQEPLDRRIDVSAVAAYLGCARTGHQPPVRTWVPGADGLLVSCRQSL